MSRAFAVACVHAPSRGSADRRARRPPSSRPLPLSSRGLSGAKYLGGVSNGARTVMAGWVDNTAEVTVTAPLPVVWELWQDKTRIPNWMPWIHSVEPVPGVPGDTKWLLKTNQFGQDFEFSWIARDLPPVKKEKIHWFSTDGLNNKGAVTFVQRPDGRTVVRMNISYEVPDILVPFGAALTPLVASILQADLERFGTFSSKVVAAMGAGKRR